MVVVVVLGVLLLLFVIFCFVYFSFRWHHIIQEEGVKNPTFPLLFMHERGK